MSTHSKEVSKKAGMPPGALIFIGEKKSEKVRIRIVDYDETHLQEKEAETIEECFPFRDTATVTWINIDGIHLVEIIDKIGKHFNIHPLILEDIVNTRQRPKVDEFGEYIFTILKMIYYDEENEEILVEQFSLILGSNFVISFQEAEGDVFNHLRERIRKRPDRFAKLGASYLAYCLIDLIVDGYFIILDKLGEKIETLEEESVTAPTPKSLQIIKNSKKDVIYLRKSIWPVREIIGGLQRSESSLIKEDTKIYLKDVYDHTIQVVDTVETFRDMLSGILDVYLSSISNRMNEIMKLLTLVATIFIPLTFIVGIYGMNFRYMPELEWLWGYPLIMLLMTGIGISMYTYFKQKKWLG